MGNKLPFGEHENKSGDEGWITMLEKRLTPIFARPKALTPEEACAAPYNTITTAATATTTTTTTATTTTTYRTVQCLPKQERGNAAVRTSKAGPGRSVFPVCRKRPRGEARAIPRWCPETLKRSHAGIVSCFPSAACQSGIQPRGACRPQQGPGRHHLA